MSLASPLRLSLIPGVALGGLLGGVLITNIVTRMSQRERISSLFVRRRARKPCPRCAGFGITRCSLCGGEAMCICTGRFIQQIPCPMCVMRRHVPCRMCGGTGVRPSEKGLMQRVELTMLTIMRVLDEARATLLAPLVGIYASRTSSGGTQTWRSMPSQRKRIRRDATTAFEECNSGSNGVLTGRTKPIVEESPSITEVSTDTSGKSPTYHNTTKRTRHGTIVSKSF